MRTFSLALMLFGALGCLTETGFAQDSFSCSQCVCVADGSCSDQTGTCDGTTTIDCRSTTFTASCSASYYLRGILTCNGGTIYCKHCYACVRLYDGAIELGNVHTGCIAGACDQTIASPIALTAGRTYTLVTCLRKCDDGDCSECDCVARGYAYTPSWNSCSTIPACNP